ncbi:putative phosphoglycerate mutase family protein [Tricholoma matsutake]|nr:putative phosphoglycerate mutase family protein [Tricholoma matsutake 945]
MGWFDHDSEEAEAHRQVCLVTGGGHEAKLSHELLAGAASFAAARAYEKHVAENGQPPSHALAKELLAGFAGSFIDREVETRGLDFIDKQKAKHEAKKRAEEGFQYEGR